MEEETKELLRKEVKELFSRVPTGKNESDLEEAHRQVLFYTNKIDLDSKVDKESLSMEFSI